MAWLMLSAGCAPTSPGVDPEVAALVRALQAPERDPDAATASESVHDLGPVLARGQTIRHDFTLRNPSDRPLRIVAAEALVPCCSAVSPLPESVPPHGEIAVPIVFKPGFQSGRKQVGFVVQTDDPTAPVRSFALVASLASEFEAHVVEGSDTTLPLNRPGRQTIRVVCRRVGDEGRGAPADITPTTPIAAEFVGPPQELVLPDGSIEATRDVTVMLPAGMAVGTHYSVVDLHWPDGTARNHRVSWRVTPRIEASPAGIVFRASEGPFEKVILLRSLDHPFRVLGVEGGCLAGAGTSPDEERTSHKLRVVIEARRGTSERPTELRISTDHPDQPLVTISVLVLPKVEEAQP